MSIIHLETQINAPAIECFDLARSVDAHVGSATQTRERAIDGVTSGMMSLNDVVTWEAVHFGVKQRLTVKITEFESPFRFVDVQVQGTFHTLKHIHEFIPNKNGTLMKDTFEFRSPFGLVGRLLDKLFLEAYLRNFLIRRNAYLKQAAESRQPDLRVTKG
jgi:ligand-binding SRPBCC domain-containing protein